MRLDDSNAVLSEHLNRLLATTDGARLEISRRMGVADGTLGRIKYGRGNPTLDVVDRIAKYFRVEPWTLIQPTGLASSSSPPPVDQALLTTCIARAMALFYEVRRAPSAADIASVAGHLYATVARSRDMAKAEKQVQTLLHGLTDPSLPLELKELPDA
jgi:transcriptional regulator with XRE-family HTH domain